MGMSLVSVALTCMRVSMVVEEEEADKVGGEAKAANNQNELGLRDFLRLNKALDGLQSNRNAKCYKEDTVDKRSKRFGALPLWFVSLL